jgi:hypothetical protein
MTEGCGVDQNKGEFSCVKGISIANVMLSNVTAGGDWVAVQAFAGSYGR